MPKVNLYPDELPGFTGPKRRIELGWSPQSVGGRVQIGTTELQQGAKPEQHEFGGTETQVPKPAWAGVFVELDRNGINSLIQRLREVRNEAYGVDQ